MARTTHAEISHQLVDITAKPDASFVMADKLSKTSFAQIKDDVYEVDADSRETLEHNAWLADGATLLAPDDPATITWGLWSKSQSDSAGSFPTPPVLTVNFAATHTSAGITLTFCGDSYPDTITISWYNGATLLSSKTFAVSRFRYYAANTVAGYNKLLIQFNGTKVPARRVKIAEIDYGALIVWGKDNLIKATLLTEVDPTSTELSVDTLDFEVHDPSADFNLLNPAGAYVALQKKQTLTISEYINGIKVKLGKAYLDTWENTSATVSKFSAMDALGLLGTMGDYKSSPLWAGTAAGTVYAHIFAAAGWTDYTIDAAIAAELVYGYIPVVSFREALHKLSFALRAACIPNRDGGITITRLPSAAAARVIDKDRKLGQQKITQTALINSVAVTAHSFTAGASTQLYSQALTAGTYEITFGSPSTGLSITGGTITASGVNYATVNVTSPGTVTITGTPLVDSKKVYLYEAAGLTATTRAQASAQDNTLVSAVNAAALALFLYEDYQRRILQSFKLVVGEECVGDNADVSTILDARKTGIITKLDLDLTGGFLADCEVRG